jgi:hypothetical protein
MSCAKSELCIFDGALPQAVIESFSFEELYPVNTISGKEVDIEFCINGSASDYLDLNDTLLYVEVKAIAEDGTKLVAKADCTPSNYFFGTLFKDVVLMFNSERIEGGNNVYAYKYIIESLINYSSDTIDTCLQSIGVDSNVEVRKLWLDSSKTFGMCGPIQLDFFDQPKYLLPGVSVRMKFKRSPSSFCLTSNTLKPQLQITDAKLFVRRVKVDPSVLIGHQIGLNSKNARYPIRQTEVIVYSMSEGVTSFYKDQMFGDMRIPKFVLITFQVTSNINGSYKTDPTEFKHLSVGSMTLSQGNEFRETFVQDFDKDSFVTSYVTSIIRNMGYLEKNMNIGITIDDFKNKYPFFTFVLSPDFDIHQTQLPRHGNLRLDIKFNKAIEKGAAVIIYGIFDSEIQINKNRGIIL